jgi:hypothetical protein
VPPKPPGPNSDEICGNYYEEQMDPANLLSMARDLAQAGTKILATAEEGPAKIATQLAPHGQGVLATSLISKWTQFFAQLHLPAAQFTAASAGVTAIAGIINATSIEQANVVASAEEVIADLQAARPALEFFGIDVDQEIQAVKEQAQQLVASLSGAAATQIGAVPGPEFAGGAPGLPGGKGGQGGGGQGGHGGQGGSNGVGNGGHGGQGGHGSGGQGGHSGQGGHGGGGQGGHGGQGGSNGVGNGGHGGQGGHGGGGQGGSNGLGNGGHGGGGQGGISGLGNSGQGGSNGLGGGGHFTGPGMSHAGGIPGGGGFGGGGMPGGGFGGGGGVPGAGGGMPGGAGGGVPGGGFGGGGMPGAGGGGFGGGSPGGGQPGFAPIQAPASAPATVVAPAPVTAVPAASLVGAPAAVTPAIAGPIVAGVAPLSNIASVATAPAMAPIGATGPITSAVTTSALTTGAVPPPPAIPNLPPVAPMAPAAPAYAPPPMPAQSAGGAPMVATPGLPQAIPGAPPAAAHSGPNAGHAPGEQHTNGPPAGVPTEARVVSEDTRLASASTPLVAAANAAGFTPVFGLQPLGDLVDAAPLSHLGEIQNVIEAVGGGAEVGLAAGMVYAGGTSQVVITSDRGRGWLPEGAILPKNAVSPWDHPNAARWEGLLDPARVIVEYAAAVGGKLTALASTRSSAPGVAAGIPFAIVDASKRAYPDKLDGAYVDRVGVESQVTSGYRLRAKGITDPDEQRQNARNLASAAAMNQQTGRLHAGPSRYRDLINARITESNTERDFARAVSDEEWAQLRAEHDEVCAQERALRADVRDIPVGELDMQGGRCRELLLKAYSIEALLAVRHQTATGAINNALYSWAMVNKILETRGQAS